MATPTIPRNADELAEMLADPKQVKDVVSSPEDLKNFITAYANRAQGEGTDLQRLVDEGVQKGMADFLKENGQDIKRPDMAAKKPDPYAAVDASLQGRGLFNQAAEGSKLDGLYNSTGELFRSIARRNELNAEDAGKLASLKNYSSDIPSDGGYLIPETLRSELLRVSLETSVVRPRARVIPMETLRVPFPAIDSTTNVNSVYGGIVGYWTEESGQLTESQARFSRIVLEARKLTGFAKVPSELMQDSLVSFDAFIGQMFPEALSFFEDTAFLTGDGVGKPLGVLNGNAAISVTRTTSSQIQFADVVGMYARMLPQSLSRAVWLASPSAIPQLAQLAMTRGTDGIASPPLWLSGGQAIDNLPMNILGRPVVITEKVPALGSAGDLSLVDFGFYLIGDRQAMQARQSEERYFETDEIAFRIIERVDGRPWLQSAITPANGGSTLSPIVKLAA
ncbi:phage major capsid protein [Streptomyces bangladeshensis]|uniref:Phage capsid-like C-terminal domain-containing protein n=1 Tax=Streptomyces bangladeshensis TaxID=295352 RepID=A0ABP5NKA0_9ACTN